MKASRIALILSAFIFAGSTLSAQTLLDGKKWVNVTNNSNGGSGTVQGAAYYDGKIYQFTDQGKSHGIYTISTNSWTSGGAINNGTLADCHFGSACFGPESTKNYTVNGESKTSTYPLLFVTGHDKTSPRAFVINVIDYEKKTVVAHIRLKEEGTQGDRIAAYDFAGGKIYLMGYPGTVTGMAPWVIREYTGFDFSNYTVTNSEGVPTLDMTGATYTETTGIGGPNAQGIQENLVAGTLQDCQFINGKIYFVVTRGSRYNRTEWVRVHAYDVATKKVVQTVCSAINSEVQGIVYDGNAFYITTGGDGVTGRSRVFRLGNGSGYDEWNFQPAPLGNDGYYKISTASQFVWFKQQVYSGRTTINARLMNNIDMNGQTDPYTYYVYDTNVEASLARKFDATYAFRGIFDGQSYTISNVSISSTPYYNCGLFPYCIDATIKNLKVEGSIVATATTDKEAEGNLDVRNVGMIGTMKGGSLQNVDVSGLTVALSSNSLTSENVNKLAGAESGTITKTNVITESAQQAVAGTKTEPEKEGDIYLIASAANLYWFVDYVNAGNKTAKAKLTADIDMLCSLYGEFPGFTEYSGTFDGNGRTLTGFSMDKTDKNARTGMFKILSGSAVVKNFTLVGKRNIAGSQNMHGAVAGGMQGNSLIEDVVSRVNLTNNAATSDQSILGGVAGSVESANAKINRCTYSGTITINNRLVSEIGGIVGTIRGGTVSNCLFDGTITSTSNSANLNFGGIAGSTSNTDNSKIQNCFVNGTFDVSNYAGTKSGIVFGTAARTLTIADTYYTTASVSGISDSKGASTATVTGSPIPVTDLSNLTDGTLLFNLQKNAGQSNSQGNWVAGANYPAPGVGPLAEEPAGTRYTIRFINWDDSEIIVKQVKEGDVIVAPEASRTGYDFSGWSPALPAGTTASKDETYKAQFTIHNYTMSYYVDNTYYQKQNYDYGATVTPLAAPEKTGYEFSGWSTIPATMPANDVRIDGSFHLPQGYTNGFNNQFDTCDESLKYEAAVKGADGYYVIDNGGKLFWFATQINSKAIDLDSKARISSSVEYIDLEGRNFPGIGISQDPCFAGVFDGNGKTIKGFYQNITNNTFRSALFSCIKGASSTNKAIVKNFTLLGTKEFSGTSAMHGTVVADVWSNALVEDVICSVNITATKAVAIFGGLFGTVQTGATVNRCTYSGTFNGGPLYDRIGGLVGELRGGTVSNCLFSGSVTCNSGSRKVAGIAAAANAASKIMNCYVKGTVTVDGYSGSDCGYLAPSSATKITVTDSYYNTTGSTALTDAGLGAVAPAAKSDLLTALKANSGQWAEENGEIVPADPACKAHSYDKYGFCTACGAAMPSVITNDCHMISNVAQLMAFRDAVNAAKQAAVNAKLVADIDFTGYTGTFGKPIGVDKSNNYVGTFDGAGHRIINISINSNEKFVGLFGCAGVDGNDAKVATIKNFSISGSIKTSFTATTASNCSQAHLGVIATLLNGTVDGINSSVAYTNEGCTAAQFGGVVGCTLGYANTKTISNCQFSGSINVDAWNCLAGILGYTQGNITMSSNYFAGAVILTTCTKDETTHLGGLIGYAGVDSRRIEMANNVSNGTLTPSSSGTTNKGALYGKSSSTAGTFTNNYSTSTDANDASAGKVTVKNDMTTDEIAGVLGSNWMVSNGELTSGNIISVDASKNYYLRNLVITDEADGPSWPADATSVKANSISYSRSSTYMTGGLISVCLPFAFGTADLPAGAKIYTYTRVNGAGNVVFAPAISVAAGQPCFISCSTDLTITLSNESGITLQLTPTNPAAGAAGIYGTFSTTTLGEGYYKLNKQGNKFLKTKAGSHCYPYRTYLKFSSSDNPGSVLSVGSGISLTED